MSAPRWTSADLAKLDSKRVKDMTQKEFKAWNQARHSRRHSRLDQDGVNVTLRIDYRGKVVGLNDYKSMHWTKLRKKYDPIKDKFFELIAAHNPPHLLWFELRVYHNTRLDIDNLAGTVKPFVDALRQLGVVPEDDKRYWDYLSIQHAPQLEFGSIVFEVKGEAKH